MLKQILAIIALSIAVVLSMSYAQQILQFILTAHDWVAVNLTEVFSGGQTGNLLRNLLALLAIPVIMGAIPVILYWVVKRSWFPYFMQIVWVIWLIQTAALVVLFKAGG